MAAYFLVTDGMPTLTLHGKSPWRRREKLRERIEKNSVP